MFYMFYNYQDMRPVRLYMFVYYENMGQKRFYVFCKYQSMRPLRLYMYVCYGNMRIQRFYMISKNQNMRPIRLYMYTGRLMESTSKIPPFPLLSAPDYRDMDFHIFFFKRTIFDFTLLHYVL